MQVCNVALLGYGKMGRELEARASLNGVSIVGIVDQQDNIEEVLKDSQPDVAIEFTQPSALIGNASACFSLGIPIVIGTTGWEEHYTQFRELCTQHNGSYITASNFSPGVLAMFDIVKHASELMATLPQYDPMISEIHHRHKKDAPGGTALHIANIVQAAFQGKNTQTTDVSNGIEKEELHVAVGRVGETPGTHSVLFDAFADTIEITHRARNRSGFADGALQAAKWLAKHGGQHRFEDIYQQVATASLHDET